MCLAFQLVRQRLEALLEACMRERLFEQPVREPRVARQERPVEIRAVRALVAAALEARGTVVAEARDHAPERLPALVEDRAARVVLEAGERLTCPAELAQHVADHSTLPGDGAQRQ